MCCAASISFIPELWLLNVPMDCVRPLNKLTKEGSPPLIPYMGVVIQNIIALQEFPDRVEGDLINFKKVGDVARVELLLRFLFY